MVEGKINEDYLLLLINKNGLIHIDSLEINKHFEAENNKLRNLCEKDDDNIDQIITFLNNSLKTKLPNKTFNYCKELDRAYQSIIINIEKISKEISKSRQLIYLNRENALKTSRKFDFLKKIKELKNEIYEDIDLWFKAFNIEITYEKARNTPNVVMFSHRISGWSNPEYKITENLTMEAKTNFGYGRSSYFYSLLTYKNIEIIPLSEWINYRYSLFSEVIRYTRNYKKRIPIKQKWKPVYFLVEIKNEFWFNAMNFTKMAANLSVQNEDEFIEKYIIEECEKMVNGLENIYSKNRFELFEETQIFEEEGNIYTLDINNYELIDFKTEKIIGALSFIDKIMEYDTIIPMRQYIPRIKKLSKQFIPNVYPALKNEEIELKKTEKDIKLTNDKFSDILKQLNIYEKKLGKNVNTSEDYKKCFDDYMETKYSLLPNYENKKTMHERHIKKLNKFISIYNEYMNE